MLLVYKNVKMFCEKNQMTLADLFEKLDIDENKYYSSNRSKKAQSEKKEIFRKIAEFFDVDVEELQNRFWDEPEVMWKLSSDREGLFRQILDDCRCGKQKWEILDRENAKKVIEEKDKYSDTFKDAYKFIAFRAETPEYKINLYNYMIHKIVIAMYQLEITGEKLAESEPILELFIPSQQVQRFYAVRDDDISRVIHELFEELHRVNSITREDWYSNKDYESYFVESFSVGHDGTDLIAKSELPVFSCDRDQKIDEVVSKLRRNEHIPEDRILDLKRALHETSEEYKDGCRLPEFVREKKRHGCKISYPSPHKRLSEELSKMNTEMTKILNLIQKLNLLQEEASESQLQYDQITEVKEELGKEISEFKKLWNSKYQDGMK